MVRQTFEGTWEEITQHASELMGRRVRLTVLDVTPKDAAASPSLPELMKDYIGAFDSGASHNDSEQLEKLWGEYMSRKHPQRE